MKSKILACCILSVLMLVIGNFCSQKKDVAAEQKLRSIESKKDCFLMGATRDLPEGTRLKQSDFKLVAFAYSKIPADALTSPTDVLGKTTKYEIKKDEIIMYHHFGLFEK